MSSVAARSSPDEIAKSRPSRPLAFPSLRRHRWRPLVEPADQPAIDLSRIVMVLGDVDTVTPFETGKRFAEKWRIPPANLFVRRQGHFSTALGLYRYPAALDRLAAIVTSME